MATVATGVAKVDKPESFAPSSKFMGLIEYDPDENTMDITFQSGTKIRYLQVYPSTFLSFKQSQTHDAYYARGIKRVLPSVKLIDNTIGKKESFPLKQAKKEHNLDAGLKREEHRAGTVARAFDVDIAVDTSE